MKLFISLLLLGLSLSACATGPFANLNYVNRPNFVGQFLGKWHGQDNSSGSLDVKFTEGSNGTWSAISVFTYDGTDVNAKTKSVKIDGNKVELIITWEVQGVIASTKLIGVLTNNQIEGTYVSTTSEEPATGKWVITRK